MSNGETEKLIERFERVADRLEILLPTAEKLVVHLDAQTDDATEIIMRLESVADALSRKLFEKAINEWVDEERQLQQRLKNPITTGGFKPGGKR